MRFDTTMRVMASPGVRGGNNPEVLRRFPPIEMCHRDGNLPLNLALSQAPDGPEDISMRFAGLLVATTLLTLLVTLMAGAASARTLRAGCEVRVGHRCFAAGEPRSGDIEYGTIS